MKVLYYYSQLNIGGAERSTIRLLNKMAQMGHNVTILLRWSGGELESELNSNIKKIYIKKRYNKLPFTLNNIIETIISNFKLKNLKSEKYDLVINGLLGYDPSILFKYINSKKYCQMLRCDVKVTIKYGNTKLYMDKYGDIFDYYIGVSKYTTNTFKEAYPSLSNKAITIYNIIPEIKKQEYIIPNIINKYNDYFKILTVCRLDDKPKALFRMESVCKKLNKDFPNKFKWFVVGEGPDKEKLKNKIIEDGLENTMIICGGTNNPFNYYKYCDLVAVLSYYEGLCGVVNETKIMEKPLIATKFSGIDEQIESNINGLVVENNEDDIYKNLYKIIENPKIIEKWAINNMPKEILNNEYKIHLFEKLLEENNG